MNQRFMTDVVCGILQCSFETAGEIVTFDTTSVTASPVHPNINFFIER